MYHHVNYLEVHMTFLPGAPALRKDSRDEALFGQQGFFQVVDIPMTPLLVASRLLAFGFRPLCWRLNLGPHPS